MRRKGEADLSATELAERYPFIAETTAQFPRASGAWQTEQAAAESISGGDFLWCQSDLEMGVRYRFRHWAHAHAMQVWLEAHGVPYDPWLERYQSQYSSWLSEKLMSDMVNAAVATGADVRIFDRSVPDVVDKLREIEPSFDTPTAKRLIHFLLNNNCRAYVGQPLTPPSVLRRAGL